MPIKPREMEKLILADGWIFKNQEGSHKNYIHPTKMWKSHNTFSQKRHSQRYRKFHQKTGGAQIAPLPVTLSIN